MDIRTAAIGAVILGTVAAVLIRAFRRITGPVSSGKLSAVAVSEGRAVLHYRRLTVSVSAPNGGGIRIVISYSDRVPFVRSFAVEKPDPWPIQVAETQDSVTVRCGSFSLRSGRSSARFEFCHHETEITSFEATRHLFGRETTVHLVHGRSRFFGLGAKTGPMDLTGRHFTLYNSDTYRYTPQTDPLYSSIPFFLGLSTPVQKKSQTAVSDWGLFYDCPARSRVHFRETETTLLLDSKIADMTFFAGSPRGIVSRYSELTGYPPLPPYWSLGFHQSRYSYCSRDEVETVVENFEKNGIPLDVIYLDIGFLQKNRSFTFNRESFPDPEEMLAGLHRKGIRAVLITNPGVHIDPEFEIYRSGLERDVFVKFKGKPFTGTVWPGECVFPDYTRSATRAWWTRLHSEAVRIGFDGFWNDMNEPSVFDTPDHTFPARVEMENFGNRAFHSSLHNAYGIAMVQATTEALYHYRPDERPFILTRAGYSGIQRYAYLWTGDNTSSWEHLRMNVSMVLNLAISGVPYTGADIGGYSGEPTSELFTRWIQLGAFIPFMRDHTENGTPPQEPYLFRENLDTIRRYIRLRYRLLPYLYTSYSETHKSGVPPVRPLFMEFGREYADCQESFMLGPSLLVAPVLEPGQKWMNVSLPGRMWYSLWNGKEYGNGLVTENITMEDIPVYVKGGSILPFYDGDIRNTAGLHDHPVSLQVYPDEFGLSHGLLYEDDGKTNGYLKGEASLIRISCSVDDDLATLSLERNGSYRKKRELRIQLPENVRYVNIHGRKLSVENGVAVIPGEAIE